MNDKVLTHIYNVDKKKQDIDLWNVSEKEKNFVRKFIESYETGKITRRTATNEKALIERILSYLKFSLNHINKDTPNIKDLENFFDNLIKDKYKGFNQKTRKYDGLPYSLKTKKSLLDILIKYYAWKFPDKKGLTEPLKINIKIKAKEPPSLTLDQIDKIYKGCKTPEEKYFISVLFSSGTRAEEFHNIRYSDIEMPKGKEVYVKIRIREDYTKSQGRTISLYYKNCLEAVKLYLSKRIEEGIKPEDPIFTQKYNRQKDWLNMIGNRVLGRNINYHLFRHSSASWLASKMNRQQLCIFFGWKFSSPMPDVYIKRSGVDMDIVTNKFEATEFEELKANFDKKINQLEENSSKSIEIMQGLKESIAEIILDLPEESQIKLLPKLQKQFEELKQQRAKVKEL